MLDLGAFIAISNVIIITRVRSLNTDDLMAHFEIDRATARRWIKNPPEKIQTEIDLLTGKLAWLKGWSITPEGLISPSGRPYSFNEVEHIEWMRRSMASNDLLIRRLRLDVSRYEKFDSAANDHRFIESTSDLFHV